MKIQLEHANITVPSITEARQFLSTAFADFQTRGSGRFTQTSGAGGTWEHVGNADTYIALQQNDLHEPASRTPYINDGVNHLGFVIDDMEALLERMATAGYFPTPASVLEGHPFRRRAYFLDGNGFEWEFIAYLSDKDSQRNAYS